MNANDSTHRALELTILLEPVSGYRGTADRPIFIGGLMKSGTSLLRVLLGQHPELYATYETHWFVDDVRERWDDPSSQRMQYRLSFLELSEADYAELCDRKRAEPEREFIDVVMEHCTARAGKRRWVEKTPDNIRHWPLIRRQWPGAKLIHVTREYKDCFASWKDKRRDDIDRFMAAVGRAYETIEPLLGTRSDAYMEVDYDALVSDAEAVMRDVLAQVEAPWDARCAALDLDDTGKQRAKVKDVSGRDSLTLVSLTKPIFTDSVGQWRDILSDAEAARIERGLAPLYDRFGDRWRHR